MRHKAQKDLGSTGANQLHRQTSFNQIQKNGWNPIGKDIVAIDITLLEIDDLFFHKENHVETSNFYQLND